MVYLRRMIEIRTGRLGPEVGTGPKTAKRTYYFDRQIRNCWVALTGYKLEYSSDDHHVLSIGVELSADIRETDEGRGVVVEAMLLLRDENGDDQFAGWADYLLFVDLGRLVVEGDVGGERVVNG
jgi:hypothetical protein